MTQSQRPFKTYFTIARAGVVTALWGLLSGCALGAELENLDRPISHAEKPSAIASILEAHSLSVPGGNTASDPFCSGLKGALRNGKGVHFLKPDFETTDPKDPRLGKYLQCQNYSEWPPEWASRRFSTPLELGDQKFAIYSLPLARESQTQDLLYAENSDFRRGINSIGGYFSINPDECMIDAAAPIQQSDIRKNIPLQTSSYYDLNALVYYEGVYAVTELYVLGDPRSQGEKPLYALKVYQYGLENKFKQSCGWVDPVDAAKK